MNINSILNSTSPVSLYEKKKGTKDTGFMDALRKSTEEAFAQRRAGFIEAPEKTIPAKKEYSYTVTEEQAEYFREKYGEDFDDETVGKLFNELHLKGIISDKDSRYASGKSWAYTIGLFNEYGINIMDGANASGVPDKYSKIITKDKYGNTVVTFPSKINYDDFQFYDDYEYKNAYKRFEYEYDKEVTTWKDYLEKRLAFVEYLRSCDRSKMSDFLDDSGNLWLTDKMLDDMEDNIRKAAEVIDQIFGQDEPSLAEEAPSTDETVSENEPTYSLTEKQRIYFTYLAHKYLYYNIDHGSEAEQYILNELADMGIISWQDAGSDISDNQRVLDILQSIADKAAASAPAKIPVYSFVYTLDENGNVIMPYSEEDIEAMRRYEAVREAIKNGEVRTLEIPEETDEERLQREMRRAQFEADLKAGNFDIAHGPYDFYSDFKRPEPTGDPKEDKLNEILYDYYESCYDTTHANEFFRISKEMDLTGMTNAEKYKAIYEKYQYCFGENFLDAEAVRYWARSSDHDPYWRTYLNFCNEVEKACGSTEAAQKARIEALYGKGLRPDQVRQKIIDEHYYEGMTLRDLLKMTHEMWLCGLDGGVTNILDPIASMSDIYFNDLYADTYTQFMNRESILDEPVSKQHLLKMQTLFKARAAVSSAHPDLRGVVGMLMDLFNVDAIDGGISADNDIFAHVWDKFK